MPDDPLFLALYYRSTIALNAQFLQRNTMAPNESLYCLSRERGTRTFCALQNRRTTGVRLTRVPIFWQIVAQSQVSRRLTGDFGRVIMPGGD